MSERTNGEKTGGFFGRFLFVGMLGGGVIALLIWLLTH